MPLDRIAALVAERMPAVYGTLRKLVDARDVALCAVNGMLPGSIRARPKKVTMAITAHCNLRCVGCRYGRDFMPGAQMSLAMASDVIDDAKAAGIDTLRLYGGEPLLHPRLPDMVARSIGAGLNTYVTTNGVLLEQKFDALHEAGLRSLTIGFYGTGAVYDAYVQKQGRFERLERGLAYLRDKFGDTIDVQLNFLLMRPSCSVEAVMAAWRLAQRYDLAFRVDLVHYSLPYFTEGPDRALQFRPEDAPRIREVAECLVGLKDAEPRRLREDLAGLASIPDWLMLGAGMRVPCDAAKLLWIGADGTIQLCYAAFPLGNLHERRLRDVLNTTAHHDAARDAYQLNCPNCHCERNARIVKHLPSRLKYARAADGMLR